MEGNGHLRIGAAPSTRVVRDEELLRLLLMGFTVRECIEQMRSGRSATYKVARSPEFLLKLREHSSEIAERLIKELTTSQLDMAHKLEEASAAALDEMIDMMRSMDGASGLKVKICQDLLDRDPKSSRTKRMELSGTMSHDFISPAVLVHAAATAKELEAFQAKRIADGNRSPDNSAESSDH